MALPSEQLDRVRTLQVELDAIARRREEIAMSGVSYGRTGNNSTAAIERERLGRLMREKQDEINFVYWLYDDGEPEPTRVRIELLSDWTYPNPTGTGVSHAIRLLAGENHDLPDDTSGYQSLIVPKEGFLLVSIKGWGGHFGDIHWYSADVVRRSNEGLGIELNEPHLFESATVDKIWSNESFELYFQAGAIGDRDADGQLTITIRHFNESGLLIGG